MGVSNNVGENLHKCDYIPPVVLIAYGCDPKEKEPYAWETGVLYRGRNPFGDKVRVEEYNVSRRYNLYGYEIFRRRFNSDFAVGLHDAGVGEPTERPWGVRIELSVIQCFCNVDDNKALRAEREVKTFFEPFISSWNSSNPYTKSYLSLGYCFEGGRKRLSSTTHRKAWGARNMEIEFYNQDRQMRSDTGLQFLDRLNAHLIEHRLSYIPEF